MTPPNDLLDRLAAGIPNWLAWPMSATATLAGFVGAGLIFLAAALGSIALAVGSGIAFVVAAIAWHVGDRAESNQTF